MSKEREINLLREQQRQLRKKISRCGDAASDLARSQTRLSQMVSDWTTIKGQKLSSPIMQSIVVADQFEGEIATSLATTFPTTISLMDHNNQCAQAIIDQIGQQISKLQSYQDQLHCNVAGLNLKIEHLQNSD